MFAAAVAEGVVLGSTPCLVEAVVGETDHMKRISDLTSLGQRHLETAPIRPREIQSAPSDTVTPRRGLRQQPPDRCLRVATSDYVEQLAAGHVHDRGAPPSSPPTTLTTEQGLIKPQRLHRTHPVTVRGQQRLTPTQHRFVDCVPVTTQLGSDIRHRTRVTAHRCRRPAPRAACQRRTNRRDLVVGFGERTRHTICGRAEPAMLVPHQAHRPPERRQIHQPHQTDVFGPHQPAATPTHRPRPCLDMNHQRFSGFVDDADNVDIA